MHPELAKDMASQYSSLKKALREEPELDAGTQTLIDLAENALSKALAEKGAAERSRKPGKAQRIAAAVSDYDRAREALAVATVKQKQAQAVINKRNWALEGALSAYISNIAFDLDGIDGESFAIYSVPTGEKVNDYYGERAVHKTVSVPSTLLGSPSTPDDMYLVGVGRGDHLIMSRNRNRDGELSFEVAENEGTRSEPKVRFGYTADVHLQHYRTKDTNVRVNWGTFSGMDTVDEAERTMRVHRLAITLGRVLEEMYAAYREAANKEDA